MSAHLCSAAHLSAIVTASIALAGNGKRRIDWDDPIVLAEANSAFRMLAEENAASVAHRYQEPAADVSSWTFAPVAWPSLHTYRIAEVAATVEARKLLSRVILACRRYAYQACEHPGWPTSKACEMVMYLIETCAASMARGMGEWPSEDAADFYTAA
jgi:hypothetical protein